MMHDSIERSQEFFFMLWTWAVHTGKLLTLMVLLGVIALGIRWGVAHFFGWGVMTNWQAFELVVFILILEKLCSILRKLS